MFLDSLDRQAQLLFDLILRTAVEIGNAGVDIEDGRDGAQKILARCLLVVDERLRQLRLAAFVTGDLDLIGIADAVASIDTGFHRHPLQQMDQPAWGDGRELGYRLGGIRELPRRNIAKRRLHGCISHKGSCRFFRRLSYQNSYIVMRIKKVRRGCY